MINPIDYKGISGVYKLTQKDGRFYIGSSVDIYTRLRGHKCRTFRNNFNELSIEILELENNKDTLRKKEELYIKKNWCEDIINQEKLAKGRDISLENNPNWKGGFKQLYCECCGIETIYGKSCRGCASRKREIEKKNTKGYSYHKSTGKYRAYIGVNCKSIYLGAFNTKEEARQTYLKARAKYYPTYKKNKEEL